MKKELTPEYLLTEKPDGYLDNWTEHARIGMILDKYTIQEKIDYLIKYAYFETTLNSFLEDQIICDIIFREKYNKGEKNEQ